MVQNAVELNDPLGPARGAQNYIVDGKMTGGFALIAYPVRYRDSGVMTFVVNRDGQIYQKDLGSRTDQIASEMKEYNPDSTWQPVEGTENTNLSEFGAPTSSKKLFLPLPVQLSGGHSSSGPGENAAAGKMPEVLT